MSRFDGLRECAAGPLGKTMREVWTREFVRRVMNTYNASHSTQYTIIGLAEDIYPKLHGNRNWDWVCRDDVSGHEMAVEVKRLTRSFAEETHSLLENIGQQINANVLDKPNGFFQAWVHLPGPDFKVGRQASQKLIDMLAEVVLEMADDAPYGHTITRRAGTDDRLSEVLPLGTRIDLYKVDPSMLNPEARKLNCLHVEFLWVSRGTTQTFAGEELDEFRRLVNNANKQLGIARKMGIPKTLLVLIEIGFSGADTEAVRNTLAHLVPYDYSNIGDIFLVGYIPARRVGGTALQ